MTPFDTTTTSISTVAQFILGGFEDAIPTVKLHKLCYLAQGWTLAWTNGTELFQEDFQAWRNGPMCPELYKLHQEVFVIDSKTLPQSDETIPEWKRIAIQAAIEPYISLDGFHLDCIIKKDGPWADARIGLTENEPSRQVISKEALQAHFASLTNTNAVVR